jgi:hypothetical protein
MLKRRTLICIGIGAPTQFFKNGSLLALAANHYEEETYADN